MFSKSKTKGISGSGYTSKSLSILSSSAVISGGIRLDDDLRIDGNIEGDIDSSGKVVIGPEGCVKGNIRSKSVELLGKMYGDVNVSEIVVLRTSSYYEGQIVARNIEIEAGASFFGHCKMEEETKEFLYEEIKKDNLAPVLETQ